MIMIPSVATIHAEAAKKFLGMFFDIDETFTTFGKIHPVSYQALWELKDSGFYVVPITGRSAGWCNHIVRMWPVESELGKGTCFRISFPIPV